MKPSRGMTALITGASSGIGRQIAFQLAMDGCHVVLVSRNEAALDELAAELAGEYGISAHVYAADLSRTGAAAALFGHCGDAGITVDILVNNAGAGCYGEVTDMTAERIEHLTGLNVSVLAACCSLFGAEMKERRYGWILNVSSVVAAAPFPHFALYAALKAGVTSFSRALHEELLPFGVTVTCLHPGQTATGFFDAAGGRKVNGSMLMDPRDVAHTGLDALWRGRPEVTAGWKNKIAHVVLRFLPPRLIGRMMASILHADTCSTEGGTIKGGDDETA